jgi:hypothetical protein
MKTKLSEYANVAKAAEIVGASQGTFRAQGRGRKDPDARESSQRLPAFLAGGTRLFP